ncbi:chorismate mutase [Pelagibacteraceae bacterium]|jgi:chorismate mutase|nr:chorismate mutase [Pelagibacteraceae bacterium]|tara:strand:+ start:204 stop:485 length:282 start_codon:yes stop_codon:yes gene_type:complete
MKNININKIRDNLDKIDIKLLKLIKQRSLLVDQVLRFKKNKNEIIDQKRINFILKRIKKYSIKSKIDPEVTERIWKAMIKGFINYEYKKFKKK